MKPLLRTSAVIIAGSLALALTLPACDESTSPDGSNPALVGSVLDSGGDPVEDAQINLLFRVPDYFPWDFPAAKASARRTVVSVQPPDEFLMTQNFPNPFNPATYFPYQLPVSSHVRLRIFDYTGIEVRTLVDAEQPAGVYEITWDAKDDEGNTLPNGYYNASLEILGDMGEILDTHDILGIFHASGPSYFMHMTLALTDADGRFEILLEDLPIGEVVPMTMSNSDTIEFATVGDTLRVYAQTDQSDQIFAEVGLGDLDENVPVVLTLP